MYARWRWRPGRLYKLYTEILRQQILGCNVELQYENSAIKARVYIPELDNVLGNCLEFWVVLIYCRGIARFHACKEIFGRQRLFKTASLLSLIDLTRFTELILESIQKYSWVWHELTEESNISQGAYHTKHICWIWQWWPQCLLLLLG